MTDPTAPGPAPADPYGSPAQVRATVQQQVAAAEARAAAIDALAEQVDAVRATARSLRGEVEVTAEPSGAVREVRFSDDAVELRPADLGRLVTETIARAQREAAESALRAAEATLGADDAVVAGIRDQVRRRPEPPAAGARPTL
ncbi:YbaB/EbfC family nucleoid-associated protein [Schumannella sp. 10F1B-5-1]|uniref:YbaB/EbfC family nucleoid-associated protein n=1 Tax=Schumannella sp. 10F1B-5-1 TaxID=2590780 RepID=UPI0011313B28|nr:YbaB/EbfC family nucleoid-associated protein [Schumannella sp. 10F1B-5-1]TPW76939.1 YbaB/EbfC family nucleoid-associated protein [Schumannella sp. 10F1B-5-1]